MLFINRANKDGSNTIFKFKHKIYPTKLHAQHWVISQVYAFNVSQVHLWMNMDYVSFVLITVLFALPEEHANNVRIIIIGVLINKPNT